MNSTRYNQIIDEAYENYKSTTLESDMKKSAWELTVHSMSGKKFIISQEDFIRKIKTDNEFSEKWGIQIEERELSLEERKTIYENEYTESMEVPNNHWLNSKLTTRNIPTKIVTLTHNNETIESYE